MTQRKAKDVGSVAIEDYAKAIYKLEVRGEGDAVGTSALAGLLDVSPGSVTAMLKRMAEMGLVAHEPYHGVRLTREGRRVAIEMLRHHRLLESYLTNVLGMPWDQVHDEAEVLEHYISEDLEERIAGALGDPSHDPHGDPIPSRELVLDEAATRALTELAPGEAGIFVRVSDSDPEMLRYLGTRGIAPGDRVELVERQPFDGPLICAIGGEEHPLGRRLGAAMRIASARAAGVERDSGGGPGGSGSASRGPGESDVARRAEA